MITLKTMTFPNGKFILVIQDPDEILDGLDSLSDALEMPVLHLPGEVCIHDAKVIGNSVDDGDFGQPQIQYGGMTDLNSVVWNDIGAKQETWHDVYRHVIFGATMMIEKDEE